MCSQGWATALTGAQLWSTLLLWSTELKGVGGLKRALTSDMEMRSVEFALLVFSLALVWFLLTVLSFLPFRMIMYTMYYYMLEVCKCALN